MRGKLFLGTAALIILALTLGGATGQGYFSDTLIQLAAIPLLAIGIWQLRAFPNDKFNRAALLLLLLIFVLPILQLISLPPALWTLLPGRQSTALVFQSAGMELPWLPISLDPGATLRSAFSLLPAAAIFLAVISISAPQRRLLTLVIIAIGVASVFLGLLQTSQGLQSGLYFYNFTALNKMVGFFANANHAAALLYSCLPFALAWCAHLSGESSENGRVAFVGMIVVVLILVLGVALHDSLAGLTLSLASILGAAAILWPQIRQLFSERRLPLALPIGLATIFLVGIVSVPRVIGELTERGFETIRPKVWIRTLEAIGIYFPTGSGFGTFVPVYAMDEASLTAPGTFINHAHNDWLEWALEGGIFSIGLWIAFIALYCVSIARVWPRSENSPALDQALARMSLLVIALLLFHSGVDYPLRTTAMMTVFAFACALLVSPRQSLIEGADLTNSFETKQYEHSTLYRGGARDTSG